MDGFGGSITTAAVNEAASRHIEVLVAARDQGTMALFAPSPQANASRAALKVREQQFRAVFDPHRTTRIARAIVSEKIKAEGHGRSIERGFLAAVQRAQTTDDVRFAEARLLFCDRLLRWLLLGHGLTHSSFGGAFFYRDLLRDTFLLCSFLCWLFGGVPSACSKFIDLSKDDLFTKVIELPTTVQADRNKHPKASPEYTRLDALQLALKLLANASSYGILIEVVVDERAAEVPCMIYHGGEATRRAPKRKRVTEENDLKKGSRWNGPARKTFTSQMSSGSSATTSLRTSLRSNACAIESR